MVSFELMRPVFILMAFLTSLGLASERLPNVVILYADDMGYGDLAANHPASKIPTPHLDALAAQGMRFTDAHSSSGICTPSRFALLTGQHHWRRFHDIVHALGPSVFRPDDFTVAKLLRSRGYATACVGKWHLGWDWDALRKPGSPPISRERPSVADAFDWTLPIPGGPLAQGFDYYFGDGTINFPPYTWIENDRVLESPTREADTRTFRMVPEGKWEFRAGPAVEGWDPYEVLPTLTAKAVEWIERQSTGRPFFLYFALPSPHAPIIPNAPFVGTSEAGPYGDFVVQTDACAGLVLEALERAGFSGNTLVIFTSDNGPEHYAYERLQAFGHWSSGMLRGVKRDLWEGGHRVPFIARWPGHIPAGSVSDETISQVDVAATLAALVGVSLRSGDAIDSYDIGPVWRAERYDRPLREATVQNTYPNAFALRQGPWVFIDAESGQHSKSPAWFAVDRGYAEESTPGLLYNLAEDPAQVRNLYGAHPERVARMKSLLDHYRAGAPCAPHARSSLARNMTPTPPP